MTDHVDLQAFNTLAVSSLAPAVVFVDDVQQLVELIERQGAEQLLILGEGSNVVLAPELACTVCLMRNTGISVQERDDKALITAAAGENWHQLVMWSVQKGYSGLENLALIPGSVGAAPVQNIGAYGVELAECLVSVEILDLHDARISTLSRDDCQFAYRDSLFKRNRGRYAITSVTLSLSRHYQPVLDYPDLRDELTRRGLAEPTPAETAAAVMSIRRAKLPDPAVVANVGSFFKNPVVEEQQALDLQARYPQLKGFPAAGGTKLSAAQLIDQAGWKQRGTRTVGVWQQQPLVLVNHGARSGASVLAFAAEIAADIFQRYQVQLEIEPDLIGFD